MKKAVLVLVAAVVIVSAIAWAFDAITLEQQSPALRDTKVRFGLVNATGTTSNKNMGALFCRWQLAASRIGTGSIVIHLQVAKDAIAGTPYGFVNITGASGHTVDTDTDNLGFGIPAASGHCGQYPRIKVESGASATDALTNTVVIGLVN
jgi:hypothetical protein